MLPWPIPNLPVWGDGAGGTGHQRNTRTRPVRAVLPIENYIKVLGHAWGLPRMPPLMFSSTIVVALPSCWSNARQDGGLGSAVAGSPDACI